MFITLTDASWSIISVLRYIHIEHQDWLNQKWPDIVKLKPIVLSIQFFTFTLLILVNVVVFSLFASPYGWPAKSFLKFVPPNIQFFLSIFAVSVFTLPVIVTGIFYILLVRARSESCQNKVGPVGDVDVGPMDVGPADDGPSGVGPPDDFQSNFREIYSGNRPTGPRTQEPQVSDDPAEVIVNPSTLFEYNKILMESGLPYDELEIGRRENLIGNFLKSKNESLELKEMKDRDDRTERENVNRLIGSQGCDNSHPIVIEETVIKITSLGKNRISPQNENHSIESNEEIQRGKVSKSQNSIDFEISRRMTEKESAIRSLETNLFLILFFISSTLFYLVPSKSWQTYFVVVETSLLKALLPLISTITNFGTIRSVSLQFWESIWKK